MPGREQFHPAIAETRSKKKLRLCILRGLPFVLFGNAAGFAAQFEPRNKEDLSVGLSYRWVIVGAGALMTCVGIGAMFSLAVYLQPMSVDTGWSRAGISSAMTIDFLTMGLPASAGARPATE